MTWIHYVPILTTVLSALFAASLYRRYRLRHAPHLWWWAFGITTYGVGTAIESVITLSGNTVLLTKLWYIAGAILGGYPLAQGSLYLSWPRPLANKLTAASLSLVVLATLLVVLSPFEYQLREPQDPETQIPQARLAELLAREGVAFVDARPYFDPAHASTDYFLGYDPMHFSALGHEAMARAIAEALEKQRALRPAARSPARS